MNILMKEKLNNVYRFLVSPDLYKVVLDYTSGKAGERN